MEPNFGRLIKNIITKFLCMQLFKGSFRRRKLNVFNSSISSSIQNFFFLRLLLFSGAFFIYLLQKLYNLVYR